jgi:small subunit ribosomal protein S1
MAGESEILWSRGPDEAYWRALIADEEAAGDEWALGDGEEGIEIFDRPARQVNHEEDRRPGGSPAVAGSVAQDWTKAEAAFQTRAPVELTATGLNRGGLLVSLGQLSGFVPCSHLLGMPRMLGTERRMQALHERVSTTLRLRVIEVDRSRGRLILTELAPGRDDESPDPLDRFCPGQVCHGQVVQVRSFGAFVDLGGVEGLVHISEMSWGWVDHPSDLLRPGDEVDVYVIGVNREERKVALSLKRLSPDPWTLVDARHAVGDTVEGVITNVVDFGAFMQIEEGLEGLIHISELANGNFMHPRMVVQEGTRLEARILDIDSANRRLALSLRQLVRPDDFALEQPENPPLGGSQLDLQDHAEEWGDRP